MYSQRWSAPERARKSFACCFNAPGCELYLRELQRRSSLSIRPIQQELKKLADIGLVKLRSDGNRVYYGANGAHPLFPEVRGLVDKTSGTVALLEERLADPAVELAFVFASIASGAERPDSDLDLFVIGDIGLRGVARTLAGVGDRLGRVINPHVMTRAEFGRKVRSKDHFVASVLGSPRRFVIGSDDELGRLGEQRVAQAARHKRQGDRGPTVDRGPRARR